MVSICRELLAKETSGNSTDPTTCQHTNLPYYDIILLIIYTIYIPVSVSLSQGSLWKMFDASD